MTHRDEGDEVGGAYDCEACGDSGLMPNPYSAVGLKVPTHDRLCTCRAGVMVATSYLVPIENREPPADIAKHSAA